MTTDRITSLFEISNHEKITNNSIEIDRLYLYGMCPDKYLGAVHYNDVPLDGETSDLTAIFNIRKHEETSLFLEFHNIRVM